MEERNRHIKKEKNMRYTLNGKEITKEQAIQEMSDRPISTDAKWIGDVLVLKTLKIKEDKTNWLDKKFGA